MRAGYWIHYDNGRCFEIDEHDQWMHRPGNPERLGVAPEVIARIADYRVGEDRDAFLRYLFAHAPVMRARGHGAYITFEFDSPSWELPLKAIRAWGEANAGPLLGLRINNLHSGESRHLRWDGFSASTPPGDNPTERESLSRSFFKGKT